MISGAIYHAARRRGGGLAARGARAAAGDAGNRIYQEHVRGWIGPLSDGIPQRPE